MEPLPNGDALQFLSERVIQVGTLVVRRSAALATGPFDEELVSSEDWAWQLRLASAHRVVGIPVPVCQIRRHRDPSDLDLAVWWTRRRHDDVAVERAYQHVRPRLPLKDRVLWRLKAHKVNGTDTASALSWALSCHERGVAQRAAGWMAAAWYISPLHTLKLVARHRALLPIAATPCAAASAYRDRPWTEVHVYHSAVATRLRGPTARLVADDTGASQRDTGMTDAGTDADGARMSHTGGFDAVS